MLQFLNQLIKSKDTRAAQVRELPSFDAVIRLLEKKAQVEDNKDLTAQLENCRSANEADEGASALQYLDHLFEIFIPVLRSSAADSKLVKHWKFNLRELLVKVPFSGEQLEIANAIKENLDKKGDLKECTNRTKKLLLSYANVVQEDRQEVQEFLKNISSKLHGIYSEINEAQQTCSNNNKSKSSIRNSISTGMQKLKDSFNTDEDLNSLKENLNQLVDALQEKVEKEIEQEENDTLILERKIVGLSNKVKSLEDHAEDLKDNLRKKHEEAITDPLTGLYNRAAYIQALEKAWLSWKEQNVQATLLVWDIDHFKLLNDRYGHAAGDKVLQSIARKFKSSLDENDIVARFGGEEFVMLLNGKSIQDGEQLAEKIRSIISTTEFTYKQQPLQVTISCGVAAFVDSDTPTTIFERADKALYKAKRTGRNKVEVLASVA